MKHLSRALANPYLKFISLIVAATAIAFPASPGWSAAGSLETAAVMAPLDIRNDAEMQAFDNLLAEAKAIGVNTVSVDVWWGKAETGGDQQFDWTYYDQVFAKIRQAGLKIAPILSFHRCGTGPGDDGCDIPLPGWLWSSFTAEGLSPNDLKYESETGKIQDDAVAPWATATPAVLGQFSELMQAFATHFAPLADSFVEINISLGPTGELRYPAYNKGPNGDKWEYPDRGNFQAYSRLAQQSFRDWALTSFGGLSGVNAHWGFHLANPDEIRAPGGEQPANSGRRAQPFVDDNDQVDTQYGKDFIDWYNQSLVDHGRRLLLAANKALTGPMAKIPLGMKLPGVHWQMKPCSPHPRIAEITAGLVRTSLNLSSRSDAYGYKVIMDMIADVKQQIGRDLILHFTAAEMDNDPACGDGNSMAEALVFWISQAAQDRNITHKSENALACVDKPGDDRTWDHIRNVFSYAPYHGFTLLRLTNGPCSPDEPGTHTWDIDKAQYQRFIRDFPPPGAWYFRGTPNNWGTTKMERAGESNVFKTAQTFSGVANPRFKICHYPDWRECYPAQDHSAGDGTYGISFDADTHAITLTVDSHRSQDSWLFRGTANGWQTTVMEQLDDSDQFKITVDFARQDLAPRFKIDHFGDWRESYPTQDIPVDDCSRYEIQFNRATKAIEQSKIGPITDDACGTTPPIAGSSVQVSRFWHNHQPIYWPEWNGNGPQTNRVQYAWDSILLKEGQKYSTGVGHPENNLSDIFSSDDRRNAYQGRARDALAGIPSEGGFAISYSGSLIDDVRSLAADGQLGYGGGWWNGNREAKGWTTPVGSPRLDLVGFTYHHSLGAVLPKSVLRKEIQIFKQAWRKAWNGKADLSDQSRGFFPTEMAFSTPMIDVLADEGYQWVIVASHHLSRTCPTYFDQFNLAAGSYGIYSSPPNKADLLGPSPTTGWWYGEPNPGNAAWNVSPFAYQLHRTKYVDPQTGKEKSIIVVPSDDVLSYRFGYANEGISKIQERIAPFAKDPSRPVLVMPATDGDNAWGGGFSSWMEATPQFFTDSRNAGYTPTTVQDMVNRTPPPTGETIHVEDGAWIFPESDYGSPYFLKWVEPPLKPGSPTAYPGTLVDLETPGFALKFWSWAPVITGANWVETAEQIWRDEGGTVEAWKIQAPYDWSGSWTGANDVELAWHIYLAGLDSGFNYYGGLGNDDEVKPSLATRRAIEKLSGYVTARLDKDRTSPSVFKPQRFPWNPGGYTFGWFNSTPGDTRYLKKMPSEFYIWTHAYDISGITSVSLKVRIDGDGVNPLSNNQNETYADGPEVGPWLIVPMTRRALPRTQAELNTAANNSEINYFITSPELADYYFAKVTNATVPGFRGKLLDYYIEATDTRGNVSKSDIQHVFVEDDGVASVQLSTGA